MDESHKTPAERIRDAGQSEDHKELDLWEGGYSAKSMVGSWLGAAVLSVVVLILFMMVSVLRENTMAIYAALIVVALIWAYLLCLWAYRKLGMHYELTTQQLKHREGILFRKIDRIELIDIDDVHYRQGPIQALLGVGNINVKSSDTSHPELIMRGIANISHVADMINDARRQERRKRGLHIEAI